MTSIHDIAREFFEACEAGKGWEVCKQYCSPGASFASQAEPIAEIQSLSGYADWMKGLLNLIPDGAYDLKTFSVDEQHRNVTAYAVFSGTHTGEGGPVPPTGKKVSSDYVYVIAFDGDKISHLTKIWNANWAMRQLGWA